MSAVCENCERCTWNPGPDCGKREHPHCEKCGHCIGRHWQEIGTTDGGGRVSVRSNVDEPGRSGGGEP